MTNNSVVDKGFRQQPDILPVITRTSILISRMRKHIETENCSHCRAVLDDNGSVPQPQSINHNYSQPTTNPSPKPTKRRLNCYE
jgi:hypothetical protein